MPSTRASSARWLALHTGSEAEARETFSGDLGLHGASPGKKWTAQAAIAACGGGVEHLIRSPNDALLRLDHPCPGVAAFGTFPCGGPIMVVINFSFFGDQAPGILSRETPKWDAWFQHRFPASSGPSG